MIGSLRGRLVQKQPPAVLIDVQGVGYEVEAPMSTIFALPAVGEEVYLQTHLIARDDQQALYGFSTAAERQLFRDLLKVNRVGAKLALAILSGISVADFVACVQTEDKARLAKLPGLGRKTAERLILDLRDRYAQTDAGISASMGSSGVASATPQTEAFNALVSLGYKPPEARRMLDGVDAEDEVTTEELLRKVLRSAAAT